jgi:hypothetical protein
VGGGGIVPDRLVTLGSEEGGAGDAALGAARQLLARARDRKTLIAALAAN